LNAPELLAAPHATAPASAPARAGKMAAPPRETRRHAVTSIIQRLHEQSGGLSRVHHTHPALYAKARRAFGSWREAVAAAGLDYVRERRDSLRRGLSMRDQRRAAWRATAHFLASRPGAGMAELDLERPELARRVRRLWGDLDGARAWAEQNRERLKSAV